MNRRPTQTGQTRDAGTERRDQDQASAEGEVAVALALVVSEHWTEVAYLGSTLEESRVRYFRPRIASDTFHPSDMSARATLPTSDPKSFVDALFELYRDRGESHYDEDVTQIAHALQAARLASEAGADQELIVAALLHDVGHLLEGEEDANAEFLAEDQHHEAVGASALAAFLPPAVTEAVRLHVVAKRYLCTVDPDYHARLSAASVRSLAVQGGTLSDAACQRLTENPHFERAVMLRKFDEQAKELDASTPGMEEFRSVILGMCK